MSLITYLPTSISSNPSCMIPLANWSRYGLAFPTFVSPLDRLSQMLELAAGKQSFECLNLFRHLMVDIMSMTIYGFHHGALRNLTLGIEDPLSTAVYDFPKRGVIVRFSPPRSDKSAILPNPFRSAA